MADPATPDAPVPGRINRRGRAGAGYPPPARRRLRVFSLDPTHSRLSGSSVVLSVPWEELQPGPRGSRIAVADWYPDGSGPEPGVDLDDRDLLAQDGLAPDESDPQFHHQMVYAVLASLLETLDQARGRRLVWSNVWRGTEGPPVRPLTVMPHALSIANAHFSPGVGLSFGSFQASGDLSSGLFPNQWVHACLSHDIVNHEAAHAFLYELRPQSLEPTGLDSIAFHEGFADIVAVLQHFRLPGLLEGQILRSGAAIWEPGPFVELAGEFGRGAGRTGALRKALDDTDEPTPYTQFDEPHARGAVLTAALFEAFFGAYTTGIAPQLRVAGIRGAGSTPTLPQELVGQVAEQARLAAAMVLTMTVRAIDYLPPVDITFGDFVDAVVCADTDLFPEDRFGFRRSFVEACRRRGIVPASGRPAGRRPDDTVARQLDPLPTRQALMIATRDLAGWSVSRSGRARSAGQLERSWQNALRGWAGRNAERLGLDPEAVELDGGAAGFRMNQDGFPTAVVTARFTQRNRRAEADFGDRLGGVPLVGGVTLVAEADGRVRHVVSKPVPGVGVAGGNALERMLDFADRSAEASGVPRSLAGWMHALYDLAGMH